MLVRGFAAGFVGFTDWVFSVSSTVVVVDFFLDVVEFLFSKGEEEEEETEVFRRLWLSWIFFFLEGEEEEGD